MWQALVLLAVSVQFEPSRKSICTVWIFKKKQYLYGLNLQEKTVSVQFEPLRKNSICTVWFFKKTLSVQFEPSRKTLSVQLEPSRKTYQWLRIGRKYNRTNPNEGLIYELWPCGNIFPTCCKLRPPFHKSGPPCHKLRPPCFQSRFLAGRSLFPAGQSRFLTGQSRFTGLNFWQGGLDLQQVGNWM